jgi:hypothetical protein
MQTCTYGFGSSGNKVSGLYVLGVTGNFMCTKAKTIYVKIDVHEVENIKFTVSDIILCKLVDRYQCLGRTWCLIPSSGYALLKMQVAHSPKQWCMSAKLLGITSQKTVILNVC